MAAGASAGVKSAAKPAPEPTEPEEDLSPDAIRQIRTKAGLSQAKMAEQIGVSLNTISNWETGRSKPRAKSRAKLLAMQQ
jgi:putative transcriptional regulator